MGWAITVHGGAGAGDAAEHEAALAGVRAAVEVAAATLRGGANAVDAAIAAVVALEDDVTFNAGTGSTLNLRGEVECDACVMDGATLRAGAVAAVRGVKNAVRLADFVRTQTDHVLIAGAGAEELAHHAGLLTGNEPTEARRARWERAKEKLGGGKAPDSLPRLLALLAANPALAATRRGTVGAVVTDAQGRCAAATSTGGVLLKLPGRIGDTPIVGAGTYADGAGAASATGHGELVMRALTTRVACERIAAGATAAEAARAALDATKAATGSADVGLVVVDRAGNAGAAHGTPFLPYGLLRATDAEATVALSVTPPSRSGT